MVSSRKEFFRADGTGTAALRPQLFVIMNDASMESFAALAGAPFPPTENGNPPLLRL
jgi:hypothetical protein